MSENVEMTHFQAALDELKARAAFVESMKQCTAGMPGYETIVLGFAIKEEDMAPDGAQEQKLEQFRQDLMAKQRLMEAMDMKVEAMLRRDEPMPNHSCALEILKGQA